MAMPYKIATLLYCFNEQDEILLLERAQQPNLGCWSPCGGKLKTDLGESPYVCAAREAHEELGLQFSPTDFHLTGLVSEHGYQGNAHWLMFLFELKPKLKELPPPMSEGRFQFFPRTALDGLRLPQTDRERLWPWFWQYRGGFFAAHCHCHPDGRNDWTLEEWRMANEEFNSAKLFSQLQISNMKHKVVIDVQWTGPYAWPKFETKTKLPPIPKHSGAYLMTFEYLNGYLIYGAGITRRPIPTRFREHTLKYLSGDYNILDVAAVKQGKRKEIWHGWGWSPEKRTEFENRKQVILDAANGQLEGFRIFVADIGNQPRILERLEASIMDWLNEQPSPFCDIPDMGMMLSRRWETEPVIVTKNRCNVTLHRLPDRLEI